MMGALTRLSVRGQCSCASTALMKGTPYRAVHFGLVHCLYRQGASSAPERHQPHWQPDIT